MTAKKCAQSQSSAYTNLHFKYQVSCGECSFFIVRLIVYVGRTPAMNFHQMRSVLFNIVYDVCHWIIITCATFYSSLRSRARLSVFLYTLSINNNNKIATATHAHVVWAPSKFAHAMFTEKKQQTRLFPNKNRFIPNVWNQFVTGSTYGKCV